MNTKLTDAPQDFIRLFKAGQDAARQGDKQQAHALFRQAIEIDPYHEEVWLWLASVVDSVEDQQVCFENVLAITPGHPVAQHQLQRLEQATVLSLMQDEKHRKRRGRWWVIGLTLGGLLAVVSVVIVAVAL
jgi:thioredoxin-like negative regulator of GroEL